MSSSAGKIPTSTWEQNKDLIVELYRSRPLKDVRAVMQSQHGFEAHSWEYEAQLKRWNIRKNATRKEWQQYFAANGDRSTTVRGKTGSNLPSVILGKSSASKKRASRWASGGLTSTINSQASRSTVPGNEPRPLARLVPKGPHLPENPMEAGIPNVALNIASSSAEFSVSLLRVDCSTSSTLPPYNAITQSRPSQSLSPNFDEIAQIMDLIPTPLHAYSPTVVQDSLSPFLGLDPPGCAVFTSLGMPAENNTVFFSMLKDITSRNMLPSTQFEPILRSQEVVLDQQSAHAVLGGFTTKIVAGILSSNNQSMTRRPAHLQRMLRNLGSQIPGERSALITGDQLFETNFARVLIFSMLNGFAGLSDVPMKNILRFLNRFIVNRLLLDILNHCPQYVSRTLTDNIFRAAIEAKDAKVLALLLGRKLVDVNEIICLHNGEDYTPIARAAVLRSTRLVKILIDAGADVKGSPEALVNNIKEDLRCDSQSTIPPESYEILNILFSAGAKAHPRMMLRGGWLEDRTVELDFFISQNIHPEYHEDFFLAEQPRSQHHVPIRHVVTSFDDCRAAKSIQKLFDLCHQTNCNNCIANPSRPLRDAAIDAASKGKVKTVKLLMDRVNLEADLSQILRTAIKSGNHLLIDFILGLGPELDPPAVAVRRYFIGHPGDSNYFSTPISEALRNGNTRLMQTLEQSGCLDHVQEGDRFEALVQAAAEAGNVVYMRDLLARSVTSKESYRELGVALVLAFDKGHRDTVHMLLEAGARFKPRYARLVRFDKVSTVQVLDQRDVEILHTLVASGADITSLSEFKIQVDCSTMVDLAHEYPGLQLGDDAMGTLLAHFMTEDALESFKDLLQHVFLGESTLEYGLKTAVEMGRVDMVEYFLDIGANPFHDVVLQYVISNQPDMLRLLFQTVRCRHIVPKCIGARILQSVIGHGIGNAEALDEMLRTGAVNFTRLEEPGDRRAYQLSHQDVFSCSFTPLGIAIQGVPERFETNLGAMRKFLDAGADPNGISRSDEYWTEGSPLMTALMVAIETGLEEAVNMLLDHGADINARPRIRTTRTALQYAAELGNTDMVHLLISRGADVNSTASSHGGATALQFAAMSGNCNLVASLLDYGAQLDALPSRIDGMWPLEGAAANGRLDMIRYLWELNVRAVAGGEFPNGFSERHCLRAMFFARENGYIGCRDLISELTGIAVHRLETDEYGAFWIAY